MNVLTEAMEMVDQWIRKAEHDLEAASRILARTVREAVLQAITFPPESAALFVFATGLPGT